MRYLLIALLFLIMFSSLFAGDTSIGTIIGSAIGLAIALQIVNYIITGKTLSKDNKDSILEKESAKKNSTWEKEKLRYKLAKKNKNRGYDTLDSWKIPADSQDEIQLTKKEELEKDIKKCPYCAEDIKKEAIKCKHCMEMLNK